MDQGGCLWSHRRYYDVMGLPPTATQEEIKARYYDLVRMYHPDHAQDKVLAESMIRKINRAYKMLTRVK